MLITFSWDYWPSQYFYIFLVAHKKAADVNLPPTDDSVNGGAFSNSTGLPHARNRYLVGLFETVYLSQNITSLKCSLNKIQLNLVKNM